MRSWRYRSRNMPRNYTIAASFITPTALLMVQVVDAAPVVPMLLARTAETMLGAVAALTIIAVGYARSNPTVFSRRGNDNDTRT